MCIECIGFDKDHGKHNSRESQKKDVDSKDPEEVMERT